MTLSQQTESQQQQQPQRYVNVGHRERQVSLVAGSAMALLGLSRGSLGGLLVAGLGGALLYRGATGHCPASAAMGVDTSDPARPEDYYEHGIHVEEAFTINRPAEEFYRFWREFENLPRFMQHVKQVQQLDEKRSHWVVSGPANMSVEWDAEIINEVPNELIAWRSVEGAQVDNSGSVRFVSAPGDRGTEVRVVIDYIPPAGIFGKWFASLFSEAPEQTIRSDLRRFKQLMETGELATIEGQSRGQCA